MFIRKINLQALKGFKISIKVTSYTLKNSQGVFRKKTQKAKTTEERTCVCK